MNAAAKSIYRKMYDAYRMNRGIRLTADELQELLFDDAITTRFSNAALRERGEEEVSDGTARGFGKVKWKELGKPPQPEPA